MLLNERIKARIRRGTKCKNEIERRSEEAKKRNGALQGPRTSGVSRLARNEWQFDFDRFSGQLSRLSSSGRPTVNDGRRRESAGFFVAFKSGRSINLITLSARGGAHEHTVTFGLENKWKKKKNRCASPSARASERTNRLISLAHEA